jgi:hypothetical protein
MPYHQFVAVIPTPYQPPYQQPYQQQHQQQYQQLAYQQPHQNQQQRASQQRQPNQQRARRPERHFDPLPVPYSKILPYLLKGGSITLKELTSAIPPYPPGYDANAHCEYHMGAPGHTVENYKALKHKVQDLIDSKAVTFTPVRPNVATNPMPVYVEQSEA